MAKLFEKLKFTKDKKATTGALAFIQGDYWSTLFPLKTNQVVAEFNEKGVSSHIYERILAEGIEESFLPQQRVYATKPRGHLRRTVKLDPVAEYFIYDLVYRNRSVFRKPVSDKRLSFGYRIEDGAPIPVSAAFRAFKKSISVHRKSYKHSLRFDIASYFNSIYHHDLCHWFESKDGVLEKDVQAFGRYAREINSGRSVDFLPQGIYPAKMLGNEFLKFIELSGQVKSAQTVRFMDDFYLFDNSEQVLTADFARIQQLLGSFSLNVNPSKTGYDNLGIDVEEKATEIKKSLMGVIEIEEYFETASGVGVSTELVEVESNLTSTQVDTLLGYLKDEALEESDADLILSILKDHSDSLLEYLPILLNRFPNLYKHIFSMTLHIEDKESLSAVIHEFLNQASGLLEYQLFWLGVIAEESLQGTKFFGEIVVKIYELSPDYKIARAKVLEIPLQDFGLKEIRTDYLKTGASDWLSWASAAGARSLKAAERNYVLDYFSKGSPLNFIVATAVKNIPNA